MRQLLFCIENATLCFAAVDNLSFIQYFYLNLIKPLTESEQLPGNLSKRARDGEIRTQGPFSEWTPEGAKERESPKYIATYGIRKLPEICWYLASARVMP